MPMRTDDPYIVVAGALVALAVLGLTGFLVAQLSGTSPAVIAAVLTAFAAVLAAVPPIIKALRGR
jgi:VIT1/CCC1 family predicted Fe2+/Mn2+ transporter